MQQAFKMLKLSILSFKDTQRIDAMIVPGIGNFSFVMDQLRKMI